LSTDVSEEHIAFVFEVEELAEQETSEKAGVCKQCSSETLVDTLLRYVREDGTLHNHRRENLKS
jgi:hypothetical protein